MQQGDVTDRRCTHIYRVWSHHPDTSSFTTGLISGKFIFKWGFIFTNQNLWYFNRFYSAYIPDCALYLCEEMFPHTVYFYISSDLIDIDTLTVILSQTYQMMFSNLNQRNRVLAYQYESLFCGGFFHCSVSKMNYFVLWES